MINKLYGPPGTGKTHTLVRIAEEFIKNGGDPTKLGYFTFTNRAADEALIRATQRYGVVKHALPYFRTLHSLAFNQLGLSRNRVFSRDALHEFANWLGLELSVRALHLDEEILQMGATEDDRTLFLIGLAAVRCDNFLDALHSYEWDRAEMEVIRIWNGLTQFKKARSLIDFNDMLYKFLAEGPFPKLDLIIIDEAQDLSRLQWHVVDALIRENPKAEVWLGGDDDQAIYEWAGADLQRFMQHTDKTVTLGQSYRVPSQIQEVAYRVSSQIFNREIKLWKPADHKGLVITADQPDVLSVQEYKPKSTLYLARNFHFLRPIAEWLEEGGLEWGYLHQKKAPHQLSTIHGAKGAEADAVVLDLAMTQRSYNELETDAEKRVWYTAVTRARHQLVIIEPYTRYNAESLVLP